MFGLYFAPKDTQFYWGNGSKSKLFAKNSRFLDFKEFFSYQNADISTRK